LFIVLWDSGVG